MLILAVRITSRTLKFIAKLNDGVEPPLPAEEGNVFITPVTEADEEFNDIMTITDFVRLFPNAHPKMTTQVLIKR